MTLAEVLRLVISRLDELQVPYMVVGSFASSAYGLVRSTYDADVVVDLRREQVREFMDTFGHDFYVDAGQIEQAIARKQSFNTIHLGTFFKVDFFVLSDAAFAQEQFSRRVLGLVGGEGGGKVCVATPEDVLLSKLRWYREGGEVSELQWRDVIGILKAQSRTLDWQYLRRWATELKIADLLDRARQEAGPSGGGPS